MPARARARVRGRIVHRLLAGRRFARLGKLCARSLARARTLHKMSIEIAEARRNTTSPPIARSFAATDFDANRQAHVRARARVRACGGGGVDDDDDDGEDRVQVADARAAPTIDARAR